jgi:hypothetical protein
LLGKFGLFKEEVGIAFLLKVVNKINARATNYYDHEQNYRQPHI